MFSKSRSIRHKLYELFNQSMNTYDPEILSRLGEEQADLDTELCSITKPARYYVIPIKTYKAVRLMHPSKEYLANLRKAGIARLDEEFALA